MLFETERELVVTRSQLVAVFTREPGTRSAGDRHRRRHRREPTPSSPSSRATAGRPPLYVGHGRLLGADAAKTVTLRIGPADGPEPVAGGGDLVRLGRDGLEGARGDGRAGAQWTATGRSPSPGNLPGIPQTTDRRAGGAWLRGELVTPLPATG